MTQRDDIIALLPALAAKFIEAWDNSPFGKANNSTPRDYQIAFDIGPKYVRIISFSNETSFGGQRTCNGFVALQDVTTKNGSCKAGDLLKCATWKAPTLNFSRGSIFDLANATSIRWTGIL